MEVVSYGIDYVRFRVETEQDIMFVETRLSYASLKVCRHHGHRFVDVTGGALELIRMIESVNDVILEIASLLQVYRLDVYIDVVGVALEKIPQPGTVIINGGNVETVYSVNLTSRGDVPVFGRAYDAMAAGHYTEQVTRFEIELKRQAAKGIIDCKHGWRVNPVEVALYWIREFYGIEIPIEGLIECEYSGKTKKLEHDRSRFYRRYGNSILRDLETMGVRTFHKFIVECLRESEREKCHNVYIKTV